VWVRERSRAHTFLGVLALACAFAAPAEAAPVTIVATATQSTVRLQSVAGKPIRALKHGQYRVVIHDKSRRCGFGLANSFGVVARSGKAFVGTVTRLATLEPGDYTYYCGTKNPARTLRVV
jgi:hypothetical protein